jgi:hypothetical protein
MAIAADAGYGHRLENTFRRKAHEMSFGCFKARPRYHFLENNKKLQQIKLLTRFHLTGVLAILGQVFGADRMSITARLRAWYRGPFVPRENDADAMLVFTGAEDKQPALAKSLGVVARF